MSYIYKALLNYCYCLRISSSPEISLLHMHLDQSCPLLCAPACVILLISHRVPASHSYNGVYYTYLYTESHDFYTTLCTHAFITALGKQSSFKCGFGTKKASNPISDTKIPTVGSWASFPASQDSVGKMKLLASYTDSKELVGLSERVCLESSAKSQTLREPYRNVSYCYYYLYIHVIATFRNILLIFLFTFMKY